MFLLLARVPSRGWLCRAHHQGLDRRRPCAYPCERRPTNLRLRIEDDILEVIDEEIARGKFSSRAAAAREALTIYSGADRGSQNAVTLCTEKQGEAHPFSVDYVGEREERLVIFAGGVVAVFDWKKRIKNELGRPLVLKRETTRSRLKTT